MDGVTGIGDEDFTIGAGEAGTGMIAVGADEAGETETVEEEDGKAIEDSTDAGSRGEAMLKGHAADSEAATATVDSAGTAAFTETADSMVAADSMAAEGFMEVADFTVEALTVEVDSTVGAGTAEGAIKRT